MKNLLLFGIQGSGKGTQAELIKKEFPVDHFSTGDEFRRLKDEDSELGRRVKEQMESGRLVDHHVTMEVVRTKLRAAKTLGRAVLLDGFPRNVLQAQDLVAIMAEEGMDFESIHLDLPEDEVQARIQARLLQLARKDDQDPAVVQRRVDIFKNETLPAIAMLREKGKVVDVNAKQTVEAVYAEVRQYVEQWLGSNLGDAASGAHAFETSHGTVA